MTVVTDVIFWW